MFKINTSNVIGLGCFGVFSFLLAHEAKCTSIIPLILIMVIGVITGFFTIFFLEFAKTTIGKKQNIAMADSKKVKEESKSFLYMIPFSIMALIAYFILGWNAVQPFFSAAVMASSTGVGTEIISAGGKKIIGMLVPSSISLLSIIIFNVLANII